MTLETALERLEHQHWTEPVERALQQTADKALEAAGPAATPIADALHGVWLGHPLHPALTDLPLGSWSTAAVLDLLDTADGNGRYAAGADVAVSVGLLGAVASAVTGLNDWRHTAGEARRVGAVHGLLNGAGTLCYAASLLLRKRGNRNAGRTLGYLGYAAVFTAAYLGGHLVYEKQIGVDHAAGYELPDDFTPVMAENELQEGQMRCVEAQDVPVLLVRQHGRIHALVNTCAHLGGPLAEGQLGDGCVTCPWHGSTFALEDGHILSGPSTYRQPMLETRVRDGQIEVRAPRPLTP